MLGQSQLRVMLRWPIRRCRAIRDPMEAAETGNRRTVERVRGSKTVSELEAGQAGAITLSH